MKKILSLASLLIIMVIILSGCVSVDYQVTVNRDGSGKISYVYGVSKQFLEQLGIGEEDRATTIEEMIKVYKENAETNNFTIEEYSDDTVEGFKATKETENIAGEVSLEGLFGGTYVKSVENNNINIKKDFIYTMYSQKTSMDLSNMANMGITGIELKYTVNLPAKAGNNNATETSNSGKTLTWKLEPGEMINIEFEAKEVRAIIYICIVGIVLIIIIAIVIIIRSNKKRKAKKDVDKDIEEAEKKDVEEINDKDNKVVLEETGEKREVLEEEESKESEDKE